MGLIHFMKEDHYLSGYSGHFDLRAKLKAMTPEEAVHFLHQHTNIKIGAWRPKKIDPRKDAVRIRKEARKKAAAALQKLAVDMHANRVLIMPEKKDKPKRSPKPANFAVAPPVRPPAPPARSLSYDYDPDPPPPARSPSVEDEKAEQKSQTPPEGETQIGVPEPKRVPKNVVPPSFIQCPGPLNVGAPPLVNLSADPLRPPAPPPLMQAIVPQAGTVVVGPGGGPPDPPGPGPTVAVGIPKKKEPSVDVTGRILGTQQVGDYAKPAPAPSWFKAIAIAGLMLAAVYLLDEGSGGDMPINF